MRIWRLILPCLCFISCSGKFRVLKSNYHFKSETGEPTYFDLNYWAAHPWKHDPSDSLPEPLLNEKKDSLVDVFFIHPTTYTKLFTHGKKNAAIDDPYIAAKTDFSNILYHASAYNQACRIFAPRYRQLHASVFIRKPNDRIKKAYEVAYADIKKAFEYYLSHWNNGRPLIIAGHSQGSMMAERLLKEFFENQPLQKKLIVSYLIGWSVRKNYFTSIKMCSDSLETGCLCSWRTFRNNFVPFYLQKKSDYSYVTNPLTWETTGTYASKNLNKGSVFFNFNKIYPHTTGAIASHGLLWISKPKFPNGFFLMTKNYHSFDYKIFYLNIRDNVRQRIASYRKNNIP